MLSKILDKRNPAFDVIQEPGSFIITAKKDRRKRVLKIVAFFYLLVAVSISVIVLTAYIKGVEVYEGGKIPLWFLAVILISEWLPAYFLLWFALSTNKYVFGHDSLIVHTGAPGLKGNKVSIPKNSFQKVLLISQSEDSSICALKIQAEGREHKILWLQPYDQCLWLGSVIAEWTGAPFHR